MVTVGEFFNFSILYTRVSTGPGQCGPGRAGLGPIVCEPGRSGPGRTIFIPKQSGTDHQKSLRMRAGFNWRMNFKNLNFLIFKKFSFLFINKSYLYLTMYIIYLKFSTSFSKTISKHLFFLSITIIFNKILLMVQIIFAKYLIFYNLFQNLFCNVKKFVKFFIIYYNFC